MHIRQCGVFPSLDIYRFVVLQTYIITSINSFLISHFRNLLLKEFPVIFLRHPVYTYVTAHSPSPFRRDVVYIYFTVSIKKINLLLVICSITGICSLCNLILLFYFISVRIYYRFLCQINIAKCRLYRLN